MIQESLGHEAVQLDVGFQIDFQKEMKKKN